MDAVAKAAAFKATACGPSTVNSSNDEAVGVLSQFIDPAVFTTYLSCLQLYDAGIQVMVTPAYNNPKTVSLSLQYQAPQPGVKAFLAGLSVYPPKAATCTIQGRSDVAGPKLPAPFKIQLVPGVSYLVTCQLAADAIANNVYTDINIYT